MMNTKQFKFLILPVLNFWPRVRIFFNITIPNLQSDIIASLERNHVAVLGCYLLTSGGIYGVEKMGLRHLLLMELQDFLNRDVARWSNVGGTIPVDDRAIYSSSEVPIPRINTEGVVKTIRRISDSPTDADAEGSEYNSSAQPLANRFQRQVIPSTPRTFQPVVASIPTTFPPSSPSNSHARPVLNPAVRPSPSQKPRTSPITTSQQLQTMASSSRRRDGLSPLPFHAAQVFQRRDCWPIRITREDPNAAIENQEAVARLFRRVDRNSREVIMYANDRTIPGTASEEMAEKFSWYEDELINDFQRTFDDLGRDN
ncbi:hypothetical protein O181_086240 [Austropuccinia psidii MF-1]|uniref:Uncharacterized protein n=1 Tax=Austropuccinia psidii MF-1 TaxID=1389203 RepID=A0A9Q3FTU8_9BASI|nr:hypothetical protein [Austropuccinia psidii MF-1]